MTSTCEYDLDDFKLNKRTKYPGQRSSRSKVIVRDAYTRTHVPDRLFCLVIILFNRQTDTQTNLERRITS